MVRDESRMEGVGVWLELYCGSEQPVLLPSHGDTVIMQPCWRALSAVWFVYLLVFGWGCGFKERQGLPPWWYFVAH